MSHVKYRFPTNPPLLIPNLGMPVRDERTNPDDEQPQQNEEQAHPILDDMPDEQQPRATAKTPNNTLAKRAPRSGVPCRPTPRGICNNFRAPGGISHFPDATECNMPLYTRSHIAGWP